MDQPGPGEEEEERQQQRRRHRNVHMCTHTHRHAVVLVSLSGLRTQFPSPYPNLTFSLTIVETQFETQHQVLTFKHTFEVVRIRQNVPSLLVKKKKKKHIFIMYKKAGTQNLGFQRLKSLREKHPFVVGPLQHWRKILHTSLLHQQAGGPSLETEPPEASQFQSTRLWKGCAGLRRAV